MHHTCSAISSEIRDDGNFSISATESRGFKWACEYECDSRTPSLCRMSDRKSKHLGSGFFSKEIDRTKHNPCGMQTQQVKTAWEVGRPSSD
eukprot:scaffold301956_cov37-Prasinocladus_malaysianus.AAC.1